MGGVGTNEHLYSRQIELSIGLWRNESFYSSPPPNLAISICTCTGPVYNPTLRLWAPLLALLVGPTRTMWSSWGVRTANVAEMLTTLMFSSRYATYTFDKTFFGGGATVESFWFVINHTGS